jgi:hypothetical protein
MKNGAFQTDTVPEPDHSDASITAVVLAISEILVNQLVLEKFPRLWEENDQR